MKIMILGGAGYLGWPTAMYLSRNGHEILVVDNEYKTRIEKECGVTPLRQLPNIIERTTLWSDVSSQPHIRSLYMDVGSASLKHYIAEFQPDAIIHYAQQPSAPYSMRTRKQCIIGYANNVLTNLNVIWTVKDTGIHLIKLGTMGEYGTPGIAIEEGWIDIMHKGRTARLPYPKLPGSFYHASKVADSVNIEFACRAWGIRATDLNQGIVWGIDTEETLLDPGLHTSFHYDAIFGTALNRFVAQAVTGNPLTVYGNGSQTRGWLNIRDTLRCVELAALNPPDEGQFRVFNQFSEIFSVRNLADEVARVLGAEVQEIPNPRVELENHFYEADNSGLLNLGFEPITLTPAEIEAMANEVTKHEANIDRTKLVPRVNWR